MRLKYIQWLTDDEVLSERYAENLNINKIDKDYIDKVFQATVSDEEYGLIELDNVGKGALKYLKGRLIKLKDCYPFDFSITDKISCINKQFPNQKLVFIEQEFLVLLEYLDNSPIGPNGDLFENIWVVEKDSAYFARANTQSRERAIIQLLRFISKKNYHHNLTDFKKILRLIKSEDEESIKFLSSYKFEFEQGCCKAIEYILKYDFNKCLLSNFIAQKQVIEWLDNSSGRCPQKPWEDKLLALEQNGTTQSLTTICHWIITNDQLKHDSTFNWLDPVFTRFQKSSKWYLHIDC